MMLTNPVRSATRLVGQVADKASLGATRGDGGAAALGGALGLVGGAMASMVVNPLVARLPVLPFGHVLTPILAGLGAAGLGTFALTTLGSKVVPSLRRPSARGAMWGAAMMAALGGGIVAKAQGLMGMVPGLSAAYYKPLADYSPRDAGGMFSAMSGDYPVEARALGEPGQYNTAAVGVWDEPFAGEEDLAVMQY